MLFSLEVYGVKKVIGFRYGWLGLMDEGVGDAIELTPSRVRDSQAAVLRDGDPCPQISCSMS